jgi:hypothetical protein
MNLRELEGWKWWWLRTSMEQLYRLERDAAYRVLGQRIAGGRDRM